MIHVLSRYQKQFTLTALLVGLTLLTTHTSWACEQRWITALYDCGEVVQLDDNSIWILQNFDQHKTLSWRIGDQVDVCSESKVIRNTEKNRTHEWLKVKNTINYEEKHAACSRR